MPDRPPVAPRVAQPPGKTFVKFSPNGERLLVAGCADYARSFRYACIGGTFEGIRSRSLWDLTQGVGISIRPQFLRRSLRAMMGQLGGPLPLDDTEETYFALVTSTVPVGDCVFSLS